MRQFFSPSCRLTAAFMPSSAPWLPYDPTWLVELAQVRFPRKKRLHKALAECTTAQMKTCCLPNVCGYYFVDASRPNRPGSPWQFDYQHWIGANLDGYVVITVLKDRKVGGFDFAEGFMDRRTPPEAA